MYKPELLAPAGDLEKLKVAVAYGADAVFIGGKKFSLRAKASNFDIDDIREGVIFAHRYGARVHITVNIYPHCEDMDGLDEYLLALDQCGVDAIIVSAPYIMKRAQALKCKFEIHVSTQQSTANLAAIDFWQSQQVQRVVLARELNLKELQNLKLHTKMPLEVFIHGGLCSAFSGRCALSNYLVLRDANRGGCAHSCRWFYELAEDGKNISLPTEAFRLGSKDLCALTCIPALMDLRIDSFKIEGRMKSAHYIASVVQAYRMLIDDYLAQGQKFDRYDYSKYQKIIEKAENRETTLAWLKGKITAADGLYKPDGETASQDFIGIVNSYDSSTQLVAFEERNHFAVGDSLSVMQPHQPEQEFKVTELFDENMQPIGVANHAMQKLYLKVPFPVGAFAIIRKV